MSLPNLPVNNTKLNSFFTFLYEDTEGYVYVARKNPKLPVRHPEYWIKKFFKWPHEQERLVQYVERTCREYDIYSSPSLFRTASATKESWLGTWVIWTEFDGNTPERIGSTKEYSYPYPTVRIRSSTETHEHWYWKLSEFVTSAEIFEHHSRRTSYGLEGDTSTWNCNRVLRAPNTIHHESGRKTEILEQNDDTYSLKDFEVFPKLPQKSAEVIELQNTPDINAIIAKYAWPESVFEKFRSKEKLGKRSDSLCWLAHKFAEMGMPDNEIMSVLLNTDERWGKFYGRSDRIEQLTDIIRNTREKHPQNELPAIGIWDFVKQDIKLNWIINGFLPNQSITTMVSPAGVGKTQFALQLAIHVALGINFIGMRIAEPATSTFASLEMPEAQLHWFIEQMFSKYSDEDKKILNEKLIIIPLGRRLSLDKKTPQQALIRHVEKYNSQGVIIDSFGRAISSSTSDEAVANEILDYLKTAFVVNKKFVWAIHHFRKGQVGNKMPSELDDLKGSGAFGELSDLVLSLEQKDDLLSIKSLKSKLSKPIKEFNVRRTDDLNFERVGIQKVQNDSLTKRTNTGKTSLADTI